jgi:hypothetical protein
MNVKAEQLYDQALQLSEVERAELVQRLIDHDEILIRQKTFCVSLTSFSP